MHDLEYALPESLIAQRPTAERDVSRMLVVGRRNGYLRDAGIVDFPSFLGPGDLLVLNDTRVLPAKFSARRRTGGAFGGLFLEEVRPQVWQVLLTGSRRLRIGEIVALGGSAGNTVDLELLENIGEGRWTGKVHSDRPAEQILGEIGETPLPPYIRREPDDTRGVEDRERYQTVYARVPGGVAAPTAGLHLTWNLIERARGMGVDVAYLTLHVGLGTFKPVTVDHLADHVMHEERFELSGEAAEAINRCRREGGRVVAVGTTCVRVLESVVRKASGLAVLEACTGRTNLLIHPPYPFRVVDVLLTNFHLPRTTLLALVMAFAGIDTIRRAYRHAVEQEYRFFSYGDAMFIA